ncbi:phytanoyl-CoA dioxygenase family protein [Candidatus Pelagibacter sp.]|uniref:phytanoyl-CoA dioxygenase family protein n=1 Tax=Candidatus Pelagibacter sp. TaxID=2024849 RepID=UPI003F827899
MKSKLKDGINSIKKNGYFVLKNQLSLDTCKKLLTLTKQLTRSQKNISKSVSGSQETSNNVFNLQNKNILFIKALTSSKVLEDILKYFLNDKWYTSIKPDYPNYIIRAFGARSSVAKMPIHIDSLIPYKGNEIIAMPCALVLEDQNLDNGCTIFKPGSHLSGKWANQNIKAKPVFPKVGDIVMWDGRVWHGTTENKSGKSRWVLLSNFTRWWLKQQFDIPRALPKKIYKDLTVKEKILLGFCSYAYKDEFEGSEMKRGIKSLR